MFTLSYFRPKFVVPPGDLYTSFEKIILPFDNEIWISFGITFLAAIISVIMINKIGVRNLFNEKSIKIPILNIFRVFFGIGQTKIPNKIFGRVILVSFIFWCLVMRTAYQGKLFEFTTTAIRKPEIKSLAQLKSNNFTFFIQDGLAKEVYDYLYEDIG